MNTRDLVTEADEMVYDFTTDRVFTDWSDADKLTTLGEKLEALINEARAETWDACAAAYNSQLFESLKLKNPWRVP